MNNSIIEEIKAKVQIADLVGKSFTVTGRGRVLTTTEHDSLKLWPQDGTWHWFSQGKGGDVLDWFQHIHRCDLQTAIRELAAQAGVELRPLSADERRVLDGERHRVAVIEMAARFYHQQLLHHPAARAARDYCAGRGWTPATLERELLGFTGDNKTLSAGGGDEPAPLAKQLQAAGLLEDPLAKAVLSIPAGMIVYVHRVQGRAVYLAGRSIEGKRHWNLPAELAGAKRPYWNEPEWEGSTGRGVCLLVEGQADAIALGQCGFRAVALCGLDAEGVTGVTHVALDNDQGGNKALVKGLLAAEQGQPTAIAQIVARDPLTPLVVWPNALNGSPVKDAADLVRVGGGAGEVQEALENATPALVQLAQSIHRARGEDRKVLIRRMVDAFLALDEMTATDLKGRMATALGEGVAQFNRLVAARKKELEAQESENPKRYEYSAGGAKAGVVWEQCVTEKPDGSLAVQFAVRLADGTVKHQPSVTVGSITYIPYPAAMELLVKRVVLFPEQPEEYGDQRALLDRVQKFIHAYLDIDPFFERLAAYYVLFSWLYDLFENLPYMRALGDYGTGKTRFIQTLGAVSYRPMFASGAATVSPIFRIIDMFGGTLVVDEADLASSDSENELIKIFNVGYYKGGNVLRSKKDPSSNSDDYWPSASNVYCPKILATRKPFTDRATESRCLTKRMTTARPRPEIPFTLDRSFWAQAQRLRNQLLLYRLRSYRQIDLDPTLADMTIEPRLNQVTMALKSVVDPEMRAEIDTFVRAYNDVLIADRQMTLPAIVVQALSQIHFATKINLLGQDERDFTMKGIADATKKIVEELDPDTKINPKMISKILSDELGLPRRKPHPQTRRSMLVYEEPEVLALMARYGIEPPKGE